MKRRQLIQQGGLAGILAASAAPAIAQSLPEVKWRLSASWPKSLDTLYGVCENVSKRVAELTGGRPSQRVKLSAVCKFWTPCKMAALRLVTQRLTTFLVKIRPSPLGLVCPLA